MMSLYRTLVLGVTAAAAFAGATPALALQQRPHGDQDRAYMMAQRGHAIPLPVIKQRVFRKMEGATYLSTEIAGDLYVLKFMRGRQVIWVEVDSRTGEIIGQR